jgi:hypothetical protein
LLWTLFVGGYAALEREERSWYARMIGVVLQERSLMGWCEVRRVLGEMPVHHLLWELFEVLWREATVFILEGGGDEPKLKSDPEEILLQTIVPD